MKLNKDKLANDSAAEKQNAQSRNTYRPLWKEANPEGLHCRSPGRDCISGARGNWLLMKKVKSPSYTTHKSTLMELKTLIWKAKIQTSEENTKVVLYNPKVGKEAQFR